MKIGYFLSSEEYSPQELLDQARLAREAGGWSLVKLEVLSDTRHLLPDMEETLRALKLLIADGFLGFIILGSVFLAVTGAEALSALLRAGAAEYDRQRALVLETADPEPTHKARVALRRMRANSAATSTRTCR